MNRNKKIIAGAMLSLGAAFSFSEVQAQTCVMPPSCEELGYTKTEADCKGLDVVLKCPTDRSKMACLGSSVSQDFSPLSILYGDGTVASVLIAGKKPIGIVFDVENRLAMALTDVDYKGNASFDTRMNWGPNTDIPGLENCSAYNALTTCGTDGRKNTDAILARGNGFAIGAVNSYQPDGCEEDFCQKGKWFLPSLKELNTIYSNKHMIRSALILLAFKGAFPLNEDEYLYSYWSSTEYSADEAWALHMGDGNRGRYTKKESGSYTYNYVRPVVAF